MDTLIVLFDFVVKLITVGVNEETRDSVTLFQACRYGHVQHLEHLLFYGADMSCQNASGNTALHVCALYNQVPVPSHSCVMAPRLGNRHEGFDFSKSNRALFSTHSKPRARSSVSRLAVNIGKRCLVVVPMDHDQSFVVKVHALQHLCLGIT